jgi:predicted nucleotidyltransferase
MEKLLAGLKEKLLAGAGNNLRAVVLYGSGARGEYRKRYSDLNVLCLLDSVAAEDLQALHAAAAWWERKGFPAPQVFTLDELRASADIFAIELLDMKTHHRMIYGEDFFEGLDVPMQLHKLQVERELRTNLVKLRRAILLAPRKDRVLMALLDASAATFATLFRHTLVALGDEPPAAKREVVERIAQFAGSSPEAFCSVLEVREGKRKASELNVEKTLHGYLELVERVNEEVDRKLAGL